MPQFPASNEQAFYEVAATLIPLLLLGGVLLERMRPPRTRNFREVHGTITWLILIGGVATISAEGFAIVNLITGAGTDETQWYVAIVLVGGMALVVGAVAFPWVVRAHRRGVLAPNKWMLWVAGGGTVLLIGVIAWSLGNAVSDAETLRKQRFDARTTSRVLRQEAALNRQITAGKGRIGTLTLRMANLAIDERLPNKARKFIVHQTFNQIRREAGDIDDAQRQIGALEVQAVNASRAITGEEPQIRNLGELFPDKVRQRLENAEGR